MTRVFIGLKQPPRSSGASYHRAMSNSHEQTLATPTLTGPAVHVVSNTWARDSHDLYDFEAQHVCTKNFSVSQSSRCTRIGTEVQVTAENVPPAPGADPLLRLVEKDGHFWVDRARIANNPEATSVSCKKLWLVVRDLPSNSKRLVEGDIIKLGRFKFRVRQLVASVADGAQPELRLDDNDQGCCMAGNKEELKSTSCRICLLEGSTEDDPLVAPCRCKGSIEYVHLGCLRHWVKGRLNLSDAPAGSYFFRPLACELCKHVYPTYVSLTAGEKQPLVEVPRTQPPFIVLENLVRDSQLYSGRGLHVVSLAEKALKLGRGHESDVRIADVSISRCHATIRFSNGQFLLTDNKSKFGTLVALKKPCLLDPGASLSIQMGRTVLSLTLQQHPGAATGMTPDQLPGSCVEDERALRLSLLTRDARRLSGESEPNEVNAIATARTSMDTGNAENA
eukprot:TRINITY_DN2679_c0_g2_i2.p1 TRINITY_DN2679_c0_g2~~TRINITY_DN2679_c0_g2_i2.p1  ORF type:complete len:450 (-),score=93.68 TRINITY_DN2679_c0_g2_i2:107-1456(-)